MIKQGEVVCSPSHHGWMEIELLVVPDCPHRKAAEDLLRTALADVGLPSEFRVLTVSDAGDAARYGFAGSPTFRAAGLTCSLWLTSGLD